MSWSFSAFGKPASVAAKARETIENGYKCAEPEESIRVATLNSVATAADNFAPGYAVKVAASGSQSVVNGVVQSNQLSVTIEPVHGFLE